MTLAAQGLRGVTYRVIISVTVTVINDDRHPEKSKKFTATS